MTTTTTMYQQTSTIFRRDMPSSGAIKKLMRTGLETGVYMEFWRIEIRSYDMDW